MTKLDTETISLNQIAQHYLNVRDKPASLSKTLHDAINTVFIKRWNEDNDSKPFRTAIIVKSSNNSNGKYNVIRGRRAAIYNMLCLFSFLDTASIKRIFQLCEKTRHSPLNRRLDVFDGYKKPWHFAYFGFDIKKTRIKKIEQQLLDPSFDFYTQQLESPFDKVANLSDDISLLFYLYDDNINWYSIKQQFQSAQIAFSNNDYNTAHNILIKIKNDLAIRLPIVESLLQQTIDIKQENKDAWEYLQEILN